jgi:3-methyladenine DNA glycosylase/8-oxoguanine DNA glycosylase
VSATASTLPEQLRVEVRPIKPYRLPHRGADGLLRTRDGVVHRLLHYEDRPVVVRAAQSADDLVLLGAWAESAAAARYGIERMRFALGLEIDVRPFYRAFREDPMIGRSLRMRPWLRPSRRPEPFEALAFAICEQLIEYERAAAIERRIIHRLGPRHDLGAGWALRDWPSAAQLAGASPASLQSLDLGASRAIALIGAAREILRGRLNLHEGDHESGWRRLRAIPGIGPWTVEMLALHGQGREDQVPAGDLGLLRAVGRLLSGGDPNAFAEEAEVRAFFARYGQWAGLAAMHLLMP